ncbi:MAG: hypothetical protein GPJ50_07015 [Candidatus Heimdallarchaeota archaeon]|nr:hypothetical protein [Candidatus Heimdallarchaeota archaeon]
MKIKKKSLIIILIVICSIIGVSYGISIIFTMMNHHGGLPGTKILIDEDKDLAKYPGNGTLENPYIIEGLSFDTIRSNGLVIKDVTSCFEIRNCDISANWIAISIHNINSSYCGIYNSTFSAHELGIYASEINSFIVENSHITAFTVGFSIEGVTNMSISNNTISGGAHGLDICSVLEGSVMNNTFSGCYGISISYPTYNTLNIYQNTFLYSSIFVGSYASNLYYQKKLNFSFNSFVEYYQTEYFHRGIIFIEYMDYNAFQNSSFINNTINGKEIIFLTHKNNLSISNVELGQLTLIRCTNVTVNNISLQNSNQISIMNCTDIAIFNSSFSFCSKLLSLDCSKIQINNSRFTNCFRAINIISGVDFDISYCLFQNNSDSAIIFDKVFNSTVHHNSFMDSSSAIDRNGNNNLWFDDSLNEGNFWIDFTGYSVYEIPGSTGSIDSYPLSDPPISFQ